MAASLKKNYASKLKEKRSKELGLLKGVAIKNHYKPITYDYLRMLLKKTAKRAGIKKDANP